MIHLQVDHVTHQDQDICVRTVDLLSPHQIKIDLNSSAVSMARIQRYNRLNHEIVHSTKSKFMLTAQTLDDNLEIIGDREQTGSGHEGLCGLKWFSDHGIVSLRTKAQDTILNNLAQNNSPFLKEAMINFKANAESFQIRFCRPLIDMPRELITDLCRRENIFFIPNPINEIKSHQNRRKNPTPSAESFIMRTQEIALRQATFADLDAKAIDVIKQNCKFFPSIGVVKFTSRSALPGSGYPWIEQPDVAQRVLTKLTRWVGGSNVFSLRSHSLKVLYETILKTQQDQELYHRLLFDRQLGQLTSTLSRVMLAPAPDWRSVGPRKNMDPLSWSLVREPFGVTKPAPTCDLSIDDAIEGKFYHNFSPKCANIVDGIFFSNEGPRPGSVMWDHRWWIEAKVWENEFMDFIGRMGLQSPFCLRIRSFSENDWKAIRRLAIQRGWIPPRNINSSAFDQPVDNFCSNMTLTHFTDLSKILKRIPVQSRFTIPILCSVHENNQQQNEVLLDFPTLQLHLSPGVHTRSLFASRLPIYTTVESETAFNSHFDNLWTWNT